MFSFLLTFLFGILLLFFHDIFENSLFALGHGTVCRSCFFKILWPSQNIETLFTILSWTHLFFINTNLTNQLNTLQQYVQMQVMNLCGVTHGSWPMGLTGLCHRYHLDHKCQRHNQPRHLCAVNLMEYGINLQTATITHFDNVYPRLNTFFSDLLFMSRLFGTLCMRFNRLLSHIFFFESCFLRKSQINLGD